MGVSFKISKNGARFKPRTVLSDAASLNEIDENSLEDSRILSKIESTTVTKFDGKDGGGAGRSGSTLSSGRHLVSAEDEVSFVLNLYPDGYSIGKPFENDTVHHAAFQEGAKLLHPYDRGSESFFSAIESGRLPGDVLDDIPCKYVDGGLVCEVRDYRKCVSNSGSNGPSVMGSATITKVRLKMSLENVVKDIPLIADESWSYGDLMEVESRILKALQPSLCLDPTPRLDKLWDNQGSSKINLGLDGLRKRKLIHMPEVVVTSNNRPHGKKICIDRAPESSIYRMVESGPMSSDVTSLHGHENMPTQNVGPNVLGSRSGTASQEASIQAMNVSSQVSRFHGGAGNQRNMQDPMHGPGQEMAISYSDNMNPNAVQGKMENQEAQLSPYSGLNKRVGPFGPDGIQQQQINSYMDSLQGADYQWRNQLLQHQVNAMGLQYANPGLQKYPQLVREGIPNQDNVKLEKPEVNPVKSDVQMMETDGTPMDPRLQQRLPPHAFGRTYPNWANINDKDPRKEDLQKRKLVQSPRVSSGPVPQSPLSGKSMEISCASMGMQYGSVSSAAPPGQLPRDKSAVTSMGPVGRALSLTSSANDSMQQQHAAKRRTNSLPKTPAMNGVGSPVSVSNVNIPTNAASPSVGTPPSADQTIQTMIERFSKIEMVTMRHKLNYRKNKIDEHSRKAPIFPAQDLQICLSNAANLENIKEDAGSRPLSRSLVGGSINKCKIRVMNFIQPERTIQGNTTPVTPRMNIRMIMSEKPNDGTVAMYYGGLENDDYLNAEDHLPCLPNTHSADLLAEQFCVLMSREGYLFENHVQPRPPRMPSNNQPNAPAIPPNSSAVDMTPYSEVVPGQQANEMVKPTMSGNAPMNVPQNLLASTGMLPPGNPQAMQMSQGLLPGVSMPARPQHMDPQQSIQPQPQPQPQLPIQTQFPRASLMPPTSSLPPFGMGSNVQLGTHMANKPSLQVLQSQQQQPQQSSQAQLQQPGMQRRMMVGLGTAVGMGNLGNNMVGLGGLGNVMGIGGARAMGGIGMSAPMGPLSGMANMGQNPMSMGQGSNMGNALSQHLRSSNLTPQAQALLAQRMKMSHPNRANMLGGPQSNVAGMSGARQIPGSAGLSMLGQTLSRANMSQMQRTAMSQMAMSKFMAGVNLPMNQQSMALHSHQMQQQPQQMQPQQHQLQPQQQDTASPLQAVVSPQQVGSPSSLGIPQGLNQQVNPQQQQASPQQITQRTPMSPPLSSGAMHPMSAGNPEACPASPALSSQTLGSVGSITNSPMDLQGVNKSNSMNNA